MNRSRLTKSIAPILANRGYDYNSGAFVKKHDGILSMLYLQKSEGAGIDVQVGVGPVVACNVWPPKWPTQVGISLRVIDIRVLCNHPVFMMLWDSIDPYPDELEQAFGELDDWICTTLLDSRKLKCMILDSESFLHYKALVHWKVHAWARDELLLEDRNEEAC